jgi:hypothetical protein
MTKKIDEAVESLNNLGYYKTNVTEVLDQEGLDMFNNNVDFFNKMLNSSQIQSDLNLIYTNPQERFEKTGGKPFEITHYDYLNRAIGINDGSFIKLHLHDYFTNIASKFLEVDNPYIFNLLAWVHTWKKNYPRLHSQNWHRDREDFKLLKIFTYYSEVDIENGPFEYVPKSFCGGDFYGLYDGRSKYLDYASDAENRGNPKSQEEINKCEETKITFTGKPGDIIMTNNSGFHRGGFVQDGIRVISHCLYLHPDAYMIKTQKYFTGFNFASDKINYIDFSSEEFEKLGKKQKHIMR